MNTVSEKTSVSDARELYSPPCVVRISDLRQGEGLPPPCISGSGNAGGCATGNAAGDGCATGNTADGGCDIGNSGNPPITFASL